MVSSAFTWPQLASLCFPLNEKIPIWKKNTNGLDQIASGIQKLIHLVWGSPRGRFVDFPRRKSKLYLPPICE
jgi:hypothetical protein